VPTRNLRDFALLNVDFKRRNCLSTARTSAANVISRDAGIFKGKPVFPNNLLH
jgi:hypothetical protein